MATAISGLTTSSATAAADAMKQTFGMDSDAFMKLFIAQLQYQDPLKPQDTGDMLSQISQLTQVEQSYKTATALNNLLTAQSNSLALNSVALIGKDIVASGDDLNFDGTNPVELSYQKTAATTATTLVIKNESGQVVRTIDLGDQEVGNATFQWDGKDAQGNVLAAGAYSFSISGTDALGEAQQAITYTTGRADGVTFDNGVAYITIGAVRVPFADVMRVHSV